MSFVTRHERERRPPKPEPTPRERELEQRLARAHRALRLVRMALTKEESGVHSAVTVIDNALDE